MRYYECHITMAHQDPAVVQKAVEAIGWKFSRIDGDPVMGAGVKCYATRHFKASRPERDVLEDLMMAALALEQVMDMTVTRRKIELVLFDDRSSKVVL